MAKRTRDLSRSVRRAVHLSLPPIEKSGLVVDYEVDWNSSLGDGVNGVVRKCKKISTGETFALKCLRLDDDLEAYEDQSGYAIRELEMVYYCSKKIPDLVPRFEAAYDNHIAWSDGVQHRYLLLVTELVTGGDLFERIVAEKDYHFSEEMARRFMKSTILAVEGLHSLNIAHRDLKPENLLLKGEVEEPQVLLVDLAFAKFDDPDLDSPLKSHVGTGAYMAPEIPDRQAIDTGSPLTYGKACDMWSLGAILYFMLSGRYPFHETEPRLDKAAEEISFSGPVWEAISDRAKELIRLLLSSNPACRPTCAEVLKHPWLLNRAPESPLAYSCLEAEEMDRARSALDRQITENRNASDNEPFQLVLGSRLYQSRKRTLESSDLGQAATSPLAKKRALSKDQTTVPVPDVDDMR